MSSHFLRHGCCFTKLREAQNISQTFITEFSDLLEQYTTVPGNLLIMGDFNIHYDQPNNTDVSRLRTLLHDNRPWQVIHEPTHQKGHTLDWLVVREDCCLHQAGVMDLANADHKAVVCQLPVEHPKRRKRSVTSRNLKTIDLENVQTDVCSFCLLYTSPSPRDRHRSRMPSSA